MVIYVTNLYSKVKFPINTKFIYSMKLMPPNDKYPEHMEIEFSEKRGSGRVKVHTTETFTDLFKRRNG